MASKIGEIRAMDSSDAGAWRDDRPDGVVIARSTVSYTAVISNEKPI
jgi:hypothetical protein